MSQYATESVAIKLEEKPFERGKIYNFVSSRDLSPFFYSNTSFISGSLCCSKFTYKNTPLLRHPVEDKKKQSIIMVGHWYDLCDHKTPCVDSSALEYPYFELETRLMYFLE